MESFIPVLLVFLSVTSYVGSQRQDLHHQNGGRLSFLAIGDAGGVARYPFFTGTLKRVARQMGKTAQEKNAKFVIGLGDNFYWNGVHSVYDTRFKTTFENIFRDPSLHRTNWYMLAGNHDFLGNISAQIEYTRYSKRWEFPDFYYSKIHKIPGSCKTVQVVTIDTTLLCFKGGGRFPGKKEQYDWIQDTLRKSSADYLLVAGHHPVFSVGMHGSTSCLLQRLIPLFQRYHVTAYFSGHDHNMQHVKPYQLTTHYFVTGSASNHNVIQINRRTIPAGSLKFFDGAHGGFTLLEATPKQLDVSFISDLGKTLHHTTISPRFRRTCHKKSRIPTYYDDDDIAGDQVDSILDTFFGLQEEQERIKRARSKEPVFGYPVFSPNPKKPFFLMSRNVTYRTW